MNDTQRFRFGVIAALCGALGVASGYAIFLIHGEIEEKPFQFLGALLGAALVSYVIEWLRDLIRVGEIEVETHPVIRSLGTFVVVLMFELFISGFHAGFEMGPAKVLQSANHLMGEETAAVQGTPWTVLLVAGVWIVAGALLAAWLSVRVGGDTKTVDAAHVGRSAGWGTIGGMVIAPAVIGAYIFLGRCVVTLEYFAKATPEMAAHYPTVLDVSRWAGKGSTSGVAMLFEMPMFALRSAASHGLWVFWLVYGGMFVVLFGLASRYSESQKESPALLNIAMLGALVALGIPVVQSVWAVVKQMAHTGPLEALLGAMLLGAVIWGVPGMLLGALVPLLRRAGRSPQSWALIGYAAAALLVLASLLTQHLWPLAPAVIAAAAGVLFHRGMPVKEFWPFAALCVAIGVSGAMSVAQSITFRGVLLKLHTIDALTPEPPPPPVPVAARSPIDRAIPSTLFTPQRPVMSTEQMQRLVEQLTQGQDSKRTPAVPARTAPALAGHGRSAWQDALDQIDKKPKNESSSAPASIWKEPAETERAASQEAAPVHHEAATTSGHEEKKHEADHAEHAETEETPEDAAKALEISIAGSVGFWTTVGLLACWSMWEREEEEAAEHHHTAA